MVLIFNIGAIRPLVNSDDETINVLSAIHEFGDVKLSRVSRALRVANLLAIEVNVVGTVNTIKAESDLRILRPRGRDKEVPTISSCRVFRRYKGWAYWKWVDCVGVMRLAIALKQSVYCSPSS